MQNIHILLVVLGALGFLLFILLIALFFISRRSQRIMNSLLTIMLKPERARVQDATRVLSTILSDEVNKISNLFQNTQETLKEQIKSANELKELLLVKNEEITTTADEATKKVANMSQRLDNTVLTLQNVVSSESWGNIEKSTDRFNNAVGDLLARIDTTTNETMDRVGKIQSQIDGWISSETTLQDSLNNNFDSNSKQMKEFIESSEMMQNKLSDLSKSVSDGFNTIKSSAENYEEVLQNEDKLMTEHITKLDNYSKDTKKQLTHQMNMLTDTANTVGGHVRLTETSIEKQVQKLIDAVEFLSNSATTTEISVRGVSNELSSLTNRFNSEIKEFATSVVSEIKTVSGVANVTLENTKTAANAFSESVKTMATGVRETLIKMNTAHTQLTGQSQNLIKMSAETTAQLQPLSELIEKYFATLPDLTRDSTLANDALNKIVYDLTEKVKLIKKTVSESTDTVSESAVKLEDLAGQSRQQMIDLMSDYAKAVSTMQTLNKQMMIARASAPMDAIKATPNSVISGASGTDFLAQSESMFSKLHEQSMDLTQTIGTEIPDIVWKKYHDGDRTIFSEWLLKVLSAANKKQIREKLKSDNVFRSQATQFVRSFDKILTASAQTDTPDIVQQKLLQTSVGKIYTILKGK